MSVLAPSLNPPSRCTDELRVPAPFQQTPITSLRALVIGINDYETVAKLSSAVADANAIDEYLKCDLKVPHNQIKNLRNEQATRSAIIEALRALINDPEINYLDPILIYYAGHGSEVIVERKGADRSWTQCIVPQDAGKIDSQRRPISAIPDYMLSNLFHALASKKGNNITVIFDCCHSASSTRGGFPIKRRTGQTPDLATTPSFSPYWAVIGDDLIGDARCIPSAALPHCLEHLDEDLLGRSGTNVRLDGLPPEPLGTEHTVDQLTERGMRSHVLLAACRSGQTAFEKPDGQGGFFTSGLLRVLRNNRLDKLTYKECMSYLNRSTLEVPNVQTPVCEGANVGRFFFNATLPGAHHSFIPTTFYGGKEVTLKAGPAQGVTPESKFGLHSGNLLSPDNLSFATVTIYAPDPGDSPVQSFGSLDYTSSSQAEKNIMYYARLIEPQNRSEFKVYRSDSFNALFNATLVPLVEPLVTWTDSEAAHVLLDVDSSRDAVTFAIRLSGHNEPFMLPYTVAPRMAESEDGTKAPNVIEVEVVLKAMADWNWHKSRAPVGGETESVFRSKIDVQLFELDQPNSQGHSAFMEKNLNQQGIISITASSRQLYYLRIKRYTAQRLYIYPFYFSSASQSIRPLFLKYYIEDDNAPLVVLADMTIGGENDDMPPLSFDLNPGVTKDIGILKFFVTTSPADFDSVTQPSPFAELGYTGSSDDKFVDGIWRESEASSGAAEPQPTGIPHTDDIAETSSKLSAVNLGPSLDGTRSASSGERFPGGENTNLWDVVDVPVYVQRRAASIP